MGLPPCAQHWDENTLLFIWHIHSFYTCLWSTYPGLGTAHRETWSLPSWGLHLEKEDNKKQICNLRYKCRLKLAPGKKYVWCRDVQYHGMGWRWWGKAPLRRWHLRWSLKDSGGQPWGESGNRRENKYKGPGAGKSLAQSSNWQKINVTLDR